jgi:hypothetical protein
MSVGNRVGIGITDPQYTLDVAGDINVTGGLFSNGQDVSGALYWTETAGENIVTNANVGIGITGEPSERLHVEGNILVKGNVVPAENETYDLGTSTSAFRDLYLSGDTIFLGNTKITSDPVTGSVTFLDKDSNEVKEIVSENTQNISVQDGNTIFESGNVGIGVTNPADKLVVGGNARIDGNLTVNGTQTVINTNVEETSRIEVTNNGTGPAIIVNQIGAQPIANFQDDGVSALFIADGGNVGIGVTNPTDSLHVSGNVRVNALRLDATPTQSRIGHTGSGLNDLLLYSTGSVEIAIDSNNSSNTRLFRITNNIAEGGGAELMRVQENGNVGIGITNPSEKLVISGNVEALTGTLNTRNGYSGWLNNERNKEWLQARYAGLNTSPSVAVFASIGVTHFNTSGTGVFSFPERLRTGITFSTRESNVDPEQGLNQRMIITDIGNVGIGITNPSQLLSLGPNGAGFPTPSGNAPLFSARAFVTFAGNVSTPIVLESGNVSSVSKSATGQFTVNFGTSLPTANYAVTIAGRKFNDIDNANFVSTYGTLTTTLPTTSSCPLTVGDTSGNLRDCPSVSVVFFH